GGAGVSSIQVPRGLPQTVQTPASDYEANARALDPDAERPQTSQGGVAIRASGIVADQGFALRYSRDHGVPVRDGFIARQNYITGDRGRGGDALLHGTPILCARAAPQ